MREENEPRFSPIVELLRASLNRLCTLQGRVPLTTQKKSLPSGIPVGKIGGVATSVACAILSLDNIESSDANRTGVSMVALQDNTGETGDKMADDCQVFRAGYHHEFSSNEQF